MTISFKNIFYVQVSIITTFVILFFGRDIIIPGCFALLAAFILYPIVKWLNNRGLHNILSVAFPMASVLIFIVLIISLFSAQIIIITNEFGSFLTRLQNVFERALTFLKSNIPTEYKSESQELFSGLSGLFSEQGVSLVSNTLGYTSTFISYSILTIVFSFLILLYRSHLVNTLQKFAPNENKSEIKEMLERIQKVGQQYLIGMILLILVLGTLNSIGLLLLGIDYALFFGFVAALLAIIPYVGTIIGGLLPTLYALVSNDGYWYAIGVILIFWFIQFLEGNFLSPKIVGGSLQINALFSIVALIAGGLLWGIAGMILFLPFMAVMRVFCSYFSNLKPVAELIGDPDVGNKKPDLIKKIKTLTKRL